MCKLEFNVSRNRIIRDLVLILLILITPMWLMELLEMDVFLLDIMAESEE